MIMPVARHLSIKLTCYPVARRLQDNLQAAHAAAAVKNSYHTHRMCQVAAALLQCKQATPELDQTRKPPKAAHQQLQLVTPALLPALAAH
jgi:hypothetical protein